jgi:hypothetical protein
MTRKLLTVIAAAIGTFIYHGVATLCDDDYWPDW